MSIVVCKLPKAGLGNQLFPLTKALVFAHINKLPLIIVNYHQLKIGPYLRGEKNKRQYKGFFLFQKNIAAAQIDNWKLTRYENYRRVNEATLETVKAGTGEKNMYCFSAMPHWNDYFEGLKEYHLLAKKLLLQQISPAILTKLVNIQHPVIGVHIRQGDFRKLKTDEDFAKVGTVRTPAEYFIRIIKSIREINGSNLPATVFTDGYKNELPEIFNLGDVTLSEVKNDLLDLLLLSKSKIEWDYQPDGYHNYM